MGMCGKCRTAHHERRRQETSQQFIAPLPPGAPATQKTTEVRNRKRPPLVQLAKASEQDRLPRAVKFYVYEEIPQEELSPRQRAQASQMAEMARSRGGRLPLFAVPTPPT